MVDFPPGDMELQEQLLRLSQENRELKDYADRVTRELRRYQQARPAPPARPEDDLPLPPWATNMEMMSPLLFSYEERIAELEGVIERSVSLAEQAQALTRENDELRGELRERTEQLRNVQMTAPARDNGAVTGTEQQEELQELYRLSVDQNEALAQQNQLLKLQLERMQQSLVAGQQQLRDLQTRGAEFSKAYAVEQERVEVLGQQRSAAEQRLEAVTAELVEEVRAREQLQLRSDSAQHELKLQGQSVEMYKKSFEDRCAIALDEEERLKSDLMRSLQSEKDYRQRCLVLEQDLSTSNELLFVAQRDGDATRQEAEQMLKLMESMERRLKDISEKHDMVQEKLGADEAQVADLLIEKDRWTSSELAAKRQIERLEGRMRSEVEMLQQQADHDAGRVESAQKKRSAELGERLRKSEQSSCELQARVELADKQRAWEASTAERQALAHTTERARLQSDLEEAQQTRLRAARQADAAQQEAERLRTELGAVSTEVRERAAHAGNEMASSLAKSQQLERALGHTRDEMRAVEVRLSGAGAEHSRLHGEFQEERLRSSDALDIERRKFQQDRRGLERQLQSLAAKAQQDEQRAVDLMRAQEQLRIRWQAEIVLEKESLEAQVERLEGENRSLREKSRGILKALVLQRAGGDDFSDSITT